jgi:hypothetical protein
MLVEGPRVGPPVQFLCLGCFKSRPSANMQTMQKMEVMTERELLKEAAKVRLVLRQHKINLNDWYNSLADRMQDALKEG